jgi:uncharacterized repeat protein (TIGR03803 family)
VLLATDAGANPKYKVLHAFGAGGGLYSSLILDGEGNPYGESWGGGVYNYGTVFELSLSIGGGWRRRVLHSFNWSADGNAPSGGLIFDAAGNLYGTTSENGAHGQGAAFELSPASKGEWAETKLYSFGSDHDGAGPRSGLISDVSGNLYGTTYGGGEYGEGTVFELTPEAHGWAETILYGFCANINPCVDGDAPYAGLTWDTVGNLYGTTELGGKGVGGDWGTVFELEHTSTGWRHLLLHSFPGFQGDGKVVYAGVIFDRSGNLYGATNSGGACNTCGTVFKLTRGTDGRWKESVLYNFPKPYDGSSPGASLVFDKAGNLYGTAATGGNNACANGCGVVFKLTPGAGGKWTYSVVHRFDFQDGANPAAALILDNKGNLYGTTTIGGAGGYGVVFEITP